MAYLWCPEWIRPNLGSEKTCSSGVSGLNHKVRAALKQVINQQILEEFKRSRNAAVSNGLGEPGYLFEIYQLVIDNVSREGASNRIVEILRRRWCSFEIQT